MNNKESSAADTIAMTIEYFALERKAVNPLYASTRSAIHEVLVEVENEIIDVMQKYPRIEGD